MKYYWNKCKWWFLGLFIGTALAVGLNFGGTVDLPTDCPDLESNGKIIDKVKYTALVKKGYSGCEDLESLMKPLNEFYQKTGQKQLNGKVWWVELKDRPENQGKDFKQIIYDELLSKYNAKDI